MKMTKEEWRSAIIAQDDDQDYEESGWVAWVVGQQAFVGSYSHCSCNGTFTVISDIDGPTFTWSGPIEELVAMAKAGGDPGFPGRTADPKDRDYDHLMETWKQVIEWDKSGIGANK